LKTKLESSIERARKALRGDDLSEINAAQEELSKVFAEAGQSFYANQQAAGASGAPEGDAGAPGGPEGQPGAESGKQEDVVEADYEIVDEGKK
jgi:molecular chaperone DnaK